jgi:hypothetical protein
VGYPPNEGRPDPTTNATTHSFEVTSRNARFAYFSGFRKSAPVVQNMISESNLFLLPVLEDLSKNLHASENAIQEANARAASLAKAMYNYLAYSTEQQADYKLTLELDQKAYENMFSGASEVPFTSMMMQTSVLVPSFG